MSQDKNADQPLTGYEPDQLERDGAALRAALFRADCPETHTVGEYYLGMTSAETTASLAAHLAHCPHCAYELTRYQRELGVPVEAPTLADRVRVMLGRLFSSADLPAADQPSYALRGEMTADLTSGDGPAIFDFADDTQLILTPITDEQQLSGLLIGELDAPLRAALWQDERLRATTIVDAAGHFTLPLPADTARDYQIVVQGADRVLVVP